MTAEVRGDGHWRVVFQESAKPAAGREGDHVVLYRRASTQLDVMTAAEAIALAQSLLGIVQDILMEQRGRYPAP